jgi:hypothetical protein
MEQVNDENVKPVRESVVVDRVTLSKDEGEKLDLWLKQIHAAYSGLIKLTKSDLVNYLISEHKAELTKNELKNLKKTHFDQVKFATWALGRLKEAQKNGEKLTYADLVRLENSMGKLQDVPPVGAAKPRKVRKHKEADLEKIDPPITE